MEAKPQYIPNLEEKDISSARSWRLDDIDKIDVPFFNTSFNTCTRSGEDRRKSDRPWPAHRERRSGRDRRLYY